jgi:hypothetical protein
VCTVSIIAQPNERLRLACNRDELLTRGIALPPRKMSFGGRTALLPIDAESGGTWIAANDAGLLFVLLNAQRSNPSNRLPRCSRGTIIPMMLHHTSIDSVFEASQSIDTTQFGPFRLLAAWIDGGGVEIHSDGGRIFRERWSLDALPRMRTSSSLGDELVRQPRQRLFNHMVAIGEPSAEAQDSFHRHSWPDRNHLSVCMRRGDARTVSNTVIELSRDRAAFRYHAGPPDVAAPTYWTSLQVAAHTVLS